MKTAADLLSALQHRGVHVWADNGQLRFSAPRGTLLSHDLDMLRAQRGELIRLLENEPAEPPIAPRSPTATVPLTAIQRYVWEATPAEQRTQSQRLCTIAHRISGPLDPGLLSASLAALIERHEPLRTRIVSHADGPSQQADTPGPWRLPKIDLDVSSDTAAEQVKSLADAFAHEQVDMTVGPLFDARLFRLSEHEHVLVMALEHMISDGVSKGIVARDLWHLYRLGVRGLPLSLPPLHLQFADYAAWQQQLYDHWLRRHEPYWSQRLSLAPTVRLPARDATAPVDSPRAAKLEICFDQPLSSELQELARRERTLLSLVVLTLYVIVMARWCRQRDLLLTFVSNGRDRPQLHDMVGFLANIVYLRVEVARHDTFLDLLGRVEREFYAACEHQDVAASLLAREPADIRSEIQFNWRPVHEARWSLDGVNGRTIVEPFPFRPSIPLRFLPLFSASAEGIGVLVTYRSDLFCAETVANFGHDLLTVAREFVRCALTRIESVRLTLG